MRRGRGAGERFCRASITIDGRSPLIRRRLCALFAGGRIRSRVDRESVLRRDSEVPRAPRTRRVYNTILYRLRNVAPRATGFIGSSATSRSIATAEWIFADDVHTPRSRAARRPSDGKRRRDTYRALVYANAPSLRPDGNGSDGFASLARSSRCAPRLSEE